MNITETKKGDTVVVGADGNLDAQTEKDFQESVLGVIGRGEKSILLDFSKVPYMSSAGLRAVLIIAKQQKESGGKLAVSGLQENVAEIFSVSGFDAIVDIYSDVDAALQGLG